MKWIIPIALSCIALGMSISDLYHKSHPIEVEPAHDTVVVYNAMPLDDWDKLILAISYTESKFNPDALGKNRDAGILQITPIYVSEVNRISGAAFEHKDAFDIDASLDMFDAMQEAKNPRRDLDTAIYFHNKAPYYRKAVLENLALIERYETLRAKLLER